MPYERLQDIGQLGLRRIFDRSQNIFRADLGGGAFAQAYRGSKDPLRGWVLTWKGAHKAARIITNNEGLSEDRVNYIMNFYLRHTAPDHTPIFEFEDPVELAPGVAREVFTAVFESLKLEQAQGGSPYLYGFSLTVKRVWIPGYQLLSGVSDVNPLQV